MMNKTFGVPPSEQYMEAKTESKKSKAILPVIGNQKAQTAQKQDKIQEVCDPLNFGFDIPASNQLSRLNWKLNRWMRT